MGVSLSIPLFAAFAGYRVIVGSLIALISGVLGTTIAVLEGVQQIGKYQQNWIIYRTTAEALKREKYLFLSGAGPYASANNPKTLLAERVEATLLREHLQWQEHAEWASKQEQKTTAKGLSDAH